MEQYIIEELSLKKKKRDGEEAENNTWINNNKNFSSFVENYNVTNLSSINPLMDKKKKNKKKNKENHIKRNNNHVTENTS